MRWAISSIRCRPRLGWNVTCITRQIWNRLTRDTSSKTWSKITITFKISTPSCVTKTCLLVTPLWSNSKEECQPWVKSSIRNRKAKTIFCCSHQASKIKILFPPNIIKTNQKNRWPAKTNCMKLVRVITFFSTKPLWTTWQPIRPSTLTRMTHWLSSRSTTVFCSTAIPSRSCSSLLSWVPSRVAKRTRISTTLLWHQILQKLSLWGPVLWNGSNSKFRRVTCTNSSRTSSTMRLTLHLSRSWRPSFLPNSIYCVN